MLFSELEYCSKWRGSFPALLEAIRHSYAEFWSCARGYGSQSWRWRDMHHPRRLVLSTTIESSYLFRILIHSVSVSALPFSKPSEPGLRRVVDAVTHFSSATS